MGINDKISVEFLFLCFFNVTEVTFVYGFNISGVRNCFSGGLFSEKFLDELSALSSGVFLVDVK